MVLHSNFNKVGKPSMPKEAMSKVIEKKEQKEKNN
jgi:hypothetical protein